MTNFIIQFCDDGNNDFKQILVGLEVREKEKELTLYVRKCETFISQALFNYIAAKLKTFKTPFKNEEPEGCPNIRGRDASRYLRELTHIHFSFTDKDANIPILTKIIMYAMIEYQTDGSRPVIQEIFYKQRSLITQMDDEVRGISSHDATPILTQSNYQKVIEAIEKASQLPYSSTTSIGKTNTKVIKISAKSKSNLQELSKITCEPVIQIIQEAIAEKCPTPPTLVITSTSQNSYSDIFPNANYTLMMFATAGILFLAIAFFQKIAELTMRKKRRTRPLNPYTDTIFQPPSDSVETDRKFKGDKPSLAYRNR